MKKTFTLFMLALMSIPMMAIDIIVTREGQKIDAIVDEVTQTTVRYRKAAHPESTAFVINVGTVSSIIYEDGEVQLFDQQTAEQTANTAEQKKEQKSALNQLRNANSAEVSATTESTDENTTDTEKEEKKIRGGLFFSITGSVNDRGDDMLNSMGLNRPSLLPETFSQKEFKNRVGGSIGADITFGMTASKIFYIGPGGGFRMYLYNYSTNDYNNQGRLKTNNMWVYFPVYLNSRIFFSKKKNTGYLDLAAGWWFGYQWTNKIEVAAQSPYKTGTYKNRTKLNGFYARAGIGANVSHAHLGVGYEYMKHKDVGNIHSIYMQIGFGSR